MNDDWEFLVDQCDFDAASLEDVVIRINGQDLTKREATRAIGSARLQVLATKLEQLSDDDFARVEELVGQIARICVRDPEDS